MEDPGEGGGEELELQIQEGHELNTGVVTRQLMIKMISEDQTVDHTNMLMENDHDTIFVNFVGHETQEEIDKERDHE
jgi:hypothetical protein